MLHRLSCAARDELKQIAVQLPHEIRRERHVRGIRVDGVQDIVIAGDLLFGAVRGLGASGDEIADALRRRLQFDSRTRCFYSARFRLNTPFAPDGPLPLIEAFEPAPLRVVLNWSGVLTQNWPAPAIAASIRRPSSL